jgi:hypothetical protein
MKPKRKKAEFIAKKAVEYREPQRKGTPKGEPIGFPRNKYITSLAMMTDYPQKQIAKNAGVSHGILRKWNTEKQFKDKIAQHCRELALVFVESVPKLHEMKQKQWSSYMKKPVKALLKTEPPTGLLGFQELRDVKRYSPQLRQEILLQLQDRYKHHDPEDIDFHLTLLELEGMLSEMFWKKLSKDESNRHTISVRKRWTDLIRSIVTQPVITEENRKCILHALKRLEEM